MRRIDPNSGQRSAARHAAALFLLTLTRCGPATQDPDAWPPSECSTEQSPFLNADCLTALRLGCGDHDAESSCAAADPIQFDDGGYTVECSWAKVVKFSDATTCTVESVTARCEASVGLLGCITPCTAVPSELEIIELCGGPLGEWSAVGAEPSEYIGSCSPNVEPPAPALCDCAPAECAAD